MPSALLYFSFSWIGTNRITRVVPAVHKGGVIAMSVLPSGTLVTGGKDSCLTFFDADLQKQATTEVDALTPACCGFEYAAKTIRLQIMSAKWHQVGC